MHTRRSTAIPVPCGLAARLRLATTLQRRECTCLSLTSRPHDSHCRGQDETLNANGLDLQSSVFVNSRRRLRFHARRLQRLASDQLAPPYEVPQLFRSLRDLRTSIFFRVPQTCGVRVLRSALCRKPAARLCT